MQDWTWQRHGSAGEGEKKDPPSQAGPVSGLTDKAPEAEEPDEQDDTAKDIRVAGAPAATVTDPDPDRRAAEPVPAEPPPAEPSLAEAAAAVPRQPAGREESRAGRHADQLIDPAAAKRFQGRWRDVQAGFVDDPRDATRQADALAGEAIEALLEALGTRRRDLGGRWRADGDERPDTERLRVTLLAYRDFVDRILRT